MGSENIKKELQTKQGESKKKYKIGIALSGGGIKGLCHAGVLKALCEHGIKPDVISGVSAGAIVGALYADGHTPDEILTIFEKVQFRKMAKPHIPDGGFFKVNNFEKFLGSKLHAKTFEELKIPLRIVVTNLDKGKPVVFSKGKLLDVIIASSSIPILFSPKIIRGEHYVDGGVFRNFPVSTIRSDCEFIIGVNASPIVANGYKSSVVGVALRTYNFMSKANTILDKELCDVLIEPLDVVHYELFDTEKSHEIFNLGYNTAKEIIQSYDFKLNM